MKKILSMVLAAVMCATMMVGCGGSQKPAETDSSKEQQSVEAEAKPEEKAEVEEKSEHRNQVKQQIRIRRILNLVSPPALEISQTTFQRRWHNGDTMLRLLNWTAQW